MCISLKIVFVLAKFKFIAQNAHAQKNSAGKKCSHICTKWWKSKQLINSQIPIDLVRAFVCCLLHMGHIECVHPNRNNNSCCHKIDKINVYDKISFLFCLSCDARRWSFYLTNTNSRDFNWKRWTIVCRVHAHTERSHTDTKNTRTDDEYESTSINMVSLFFPLEYWFEHLRLFRVDRFDGLFVFYPMPYNLLCTREHKYESFDIFVPRNDTSSCSRFKLYVFILFQIASEVQCWAAPTLDATRFRSILMYPGQRIRERERILSETSSFFMSEFICSFSILKNNKQQINPL